VISGVTGRVPEYARALVSFNSYFDLTCNVLLGYAMILVLLEDAKRELDAAQSELRMTHDQLTRAALVDSLTDALNRRAYNEGVGLDMVRATFGTVVLADLDNLKMVNDQYGHAAGDRVLREVCGTVFRASCAATTSCTVGAVMSFTHTAHRARLGCAGPSSAQSRRADPVVVGSDGQVAHLRVSLGAADYRSFEELSNAIEQADRAMYEEKDRRKQSLQSEARPVRIMYV
jgi:diguanylate cyclase (GGDEF)-like protein